MNAPIKTYVMIHDDENYGQMIRGVAPALAVQDHYAELDAWCAPPADAMVSEEFFVTLYEIPAAIEDEIEAMFEDLPGEEFAALANALAAKHPEIRKHEVNVVYTAGEGASASDLVDQPNLFGGSD